jgi:hypothetical protein
MTYPLEFRKEVLKVKEEERLTYRTDLTSSILGYYLISVSIGSG